MLVSAVIRRREFLSTAAALAAPAYAAPSQIRLAVQGAGAEKWKALRYGGLVVAHDGLASTPAGAPLVGVEIRLPSYDAKTGLPPRELIEQAARDASARGAERLILNGRSAYHGVLDENALTAKCVALNQAGRICLARRLGLRYRNGRGEFGGNALEMEFMMLRTNPQLVGVAFDPAEARRAGADMVNFFARHQNRIDCIFLRDWQSIAFEALAAETAARRWSGWVVQSPGNAEARKVAARLFGV